MPQYKDSEGNIHTFQSVTSRYNKESGKFQDFDSNGKLIEMTLVEDKEIGFNFSCISSKSDSEKKEMLKKRADKHFVESGFAEEKNKMIKNLKIS
jgi:hypothetical protein